MRGLTLMMGQMLGSNPTHQLNLHFYHIFRWMQQVGEIHGTKTGIALSLAASDEQDIAWIISTCACARQYPDCQCSCKQAGQHYIRRAGHGL